MWTQPNPRCLTPGLMERPVLFSAVGSAGCSLRKLSLVLLKAMRWGRVVPCSNRASSPVLRTWATAGWGGAAFPSSSPGCKVGWPAHCLLPVSAGLCWLDHVRLQAPRLSGQPCVIRGSPQHCCAALRATG